MSTTSLINLQKKERKKERIERICLFDVFIFAIEGRFFFLHICKLFFLSFIYAYLLVRGQYSYTVCDYRFTCAHL